jgi:hypothetical protein
VTVAGEYVVPDGVENVSVDQVGIRAITCLVSPL